MTCFVWGLDGRQSSLQGALAEWQHSGLASDAQARLGPSPSFWGGAYVVGDSPWCRLAWLRGQALSRSGRVVRCCRVLMVAPGVCGRACRVAAVVEPRFHAGFGGRPRAAGLVAWSAGRA